MLDTVGIVFGVVNLGMDTKDGGVLRGYLLDFLRSSDFFPPKDFYTQLQFFKCIQHKNFYVCI